MPRLAILLVAFFVPPSLFAQPGPAERIDEALQKELAGRAKESHDASMEFTNRVIAHDEEGVDKAKKRMEEVKKRNAVWLKAVIEKHGWPGASLVERSGERDAWIIILNAKHDRPLQKRCIELLKGTVREGPPHGDYLATLTDTVRVEEGKKQIYGTQVTVKDGDLVTLPIEDEVNVDKRRKEIGLESLAEFQAKQRRLHKKFSDKMK